MESTIPIQIAVDELSETKKEFLKCRFNKSGASYRSPWTNEYFPSTQNGKYPPDELRDIEEEMGFLLEKYKNLYYGNESISSFYAWEMGESLINGFGACALIVKKTNTSKSGDVDEEYRNNISIDDNKNINSYNVFNVRFTNEVIKGNEYTKVIYKLNSTMTIYINSKLKSSSNIEISSTDSRTYEESHFIKNYNDKTFHIEKMGKMLEFAENQLRTFIEEIEIKKYYDICFKIRRDVILEEKEVNQKDFVTEKILSDKINDLENENEQR